MKIISKEIFIQKLLQPGIFSLIDCSRNPLNLKNTQIYSKSHQYDEERTIFFSFDEKLNLQKGYFFYSLEKDFFKKNFSA